MERIPEPELMNEAEQALAYAQADFSEPHNHFVALFKESFAIDQLDGCVLDLGCGPGDICIRLAKAFPQVEIIGIDGAPAMLALGREALVEHQLTRRVQMMETYLPANLLPEKSYSAVVSNSLLHHLRDPHVLWRSIQSVAQSGTKVFVMDLMRPETKEQAKEFVNMYAADEPDILQHDFYHSLLAAYTPTEVAKQLEYVGINGLKIDVISDRHFIVHGVWQ